MAWDVETGRPPLVIIKTENPAERAVMKAPGRAEIAPSFPRVSVVPAPENKAPNKTQIEQIMAAVLHDTIFVPTAVPKTLAASLAPRAQPRKSPLDKKIKTKGSIAIKTVF